MYTLILVSLVLIEDQVMSMETLIQNNYKTHKQCMEAAKVAQKYVNKQAAMENVLPGKLICKNEGI